MMKMYDEENDEEEFCRFNDFDSYKTIYHITIKVIKKIFYLI